MQSFFRYGRHALALPLLLGPCAIAQVPLADQPVFTSVNVPGNLALALSVEFPTANSMAHPDRTYSAAKNYIGYFDSSKCYRYHYVSDTSDDNHFYPVAKAVSRACSGDWSGNYLNWASMPTIDPFRQALTGGYRFTDTTSTTVLEKAWASNQGSTSIFPDSSISGATLVSGATPYTSTNQVATSLFGRGNKMRFTTPSAAGENGATFTANYYNNKTLAGAAVVTRTEGNINYSLNGQWFPTGANTTDVSASWTGRVTAPTAGSYTFRIRGDDGVRLRVQVGTGTTYTINDTGWRDQGATNYDLVVPGVTAGATLNIWVEFYQGGGGAEVSLQWQTPGSATFANVGGGGASNLAGTPVHYNRSVALVPGQLYEAFVRVKVCDPSLGTDKMEANCVAYANGQYKPEGLLQKYADKIRYSAFGYLNDGSLYRDAGVLRAKQKFIGPMEPVPGGTPRVNATSEWDGTTGLMTINPDTAEATATTSATGVAVSNSGVMNYLNKFGEIRRGDYKYFDPVSELFYATLRYYRNLGNVNAWSTMATASAADKETYVDGFPVITNWQDPILYACQRNFVLGIGDVNTHADRNLPGASGTSEQSKPAEVVADNTVDALDWTNKVGALQGLTNLGTVQNYNGCCNNNSALMAGLAYNANVTDIRPDMDGKQTVQTYWLDVLEFGQYKNNNQFYLAAKYGGFKAPDGYQPDSATAADFADTGSKKFWWSTTTDTTPNGQPRPDNYYVAARADQMVDGLTAAFSSIASQLSAYSTSFSTALPQVSALGVASYSAKYDAKAWTGELVASNTTFNAETGEPTLETKWTLTATLAAQAAGTGWDTARNIVTFDPGTKLGIRFRSASLTTAQKTALNPSYVSGDDSTNYINFVRGERAHEYSSTVSGSTKAYRDRAALLGDIVGAKSRPVGPPAAPYSSTTNPGYDSFKTDYASRTTMVYVGANDGMLHAVDGSLTGTNAGKEVFAYIPNAVISGPTGSPSVTGLAALGNPTFSHKFLVDATPLAVDLDLARSGGATGATTSNWRTLLIGGLGKGGKVIYALDITNPGSVTSKTGSAAQEAEAATKVMWEFTHADLGYTYGTPTVVKTRKYGWVVIVGSGYNNADGKGYFFFIDPRDGTLLEKVAAPCASCTASNEAGLAHINAFVLDLTDGYADAVYAGDLQGNLWRVDVTGTTAYPTAVQFARLTGSDGNPLPVTSRPLPVVQPGTNRRYVTVGTGRMLAAGDITSTQPQRFFAFLDGSNARFNVDGPSPTPSDLPSGITFPLTVSNLKELTDVNNRISLNLASEVGWFLDLGTSVAGPGWRVLSDPTSFYGTVAFAATSPSSSDVCQPNGTSRVYALDLGTGSSVITASSKDSNGTVTTTPRRFYDGLSGVVIDLSFLSVNVNGIGTSRLIAGSNSSTGKNLAPVQTLNSSLQGLRPLNWREIQVNN